MAGFVKIAIMGTYINFIAQAYCYTQELCAQLLH